MQVNAYALPALAPEGALTHGASVIIDVLRMTTTAATAMANGCAGIRMAAEMDEARAISKATGALLGGERGGLKQEGFDFGNSPLEYARARVSGKRVVMTTTNGTRAVSAAAGSKRVLLCAFRNVSAVARALSGEEYVNILCAGTKGRFSLEDTLAAGALAHLLAAREEDDMARAARLLYEAHLSDIAACASGSSHCRYLQRIGFQEDVRLCFRVDDLTCAPELQTDGWFRA